MTEDIKHKDFIRTKVEEDLKNNTFGRTLMTRFPPEPNAYLHIGHAKSIHLNFGIANEYGGVCNLRFDDTNPLTEDIEYVKSIQEDIKWLGYDWVNRLYFASDYFEQLFEWAVKLIKDGLAYVDELSEDEIKDHRGDFYRAGKDSPFRNRSLDENLKLFNLMREGVFADGTLVLRAKIDLNSPNMNMRDPIMYRIIHATHHNTGDKWCIYPMYDWAHGQSDAIEGITHSICTLEFEDHRPLYNWFLQAIGIKNPPQQIEFARLNLTYTLMSKRLHLQLLEDKYINGLDDPRMPTLSGLRRRGFTPASIRNFMDRIGVAKGESIVDIKLLEHYVREDLNRIVPRVMVVLNPIKVIIDNYPEDLIEEFDAINNPEDDNAGTHKMPFSRELYIEADDFMEDPPKQFYRLSPGREVRLKHAYIIKCESVKKDESGAIIEIHCSYDPATRGGEAGEGRNVKATLHWVSAEHSLNAEVRLYDYLFATEDPMIGGDYKKNLNPNSLKVLNNCKAEPLLGSANPGDKYQFLRNGYFCTDLDSNSSKLVFNRTVGLKDSYSKAKS